MKNVILFASLILALSSCDRKSYHVKGCTYHFAGQRSISGIVIKEKVY